MEILNKVKEWAGGLANVGISIAALMIVVEVLGLGAIPFFPEAVSYTHLTLPTICSV